MDENDTLVTVIVPTYNSCTTVIETLESIKEQSYRNIELIITDDGSKDETVKFCAEWLSLNGRVFTSYQLLKVEKNTGIPANCNRGLKAAHGTWIKFIAGDDTLKKDCIEININYTWANKQIEILQTDADLYLESFKTENYKSTLPTNFKEFFNLYNGIKQYEFLKNIGYAICSPSIFIKKSVLDEANGFDEDYRIMEDLPLWLKLTKKNIRFFYLPISTVNYRSHDKSVARNGKKYIDAKFAESYLLFLTNYFSKEERTLRIKRNIIKYKCMIMLDKIGLNNKSNFSFIIYSIIDKI